MKKYLVVLSIFIIGICSGCSIDYESYYMKYGDIANKDDRLMSQKIEEGTLNFPNDNSSYISKYSEIYSEVVDDYQIYATYYSNSYDTLYLSYDSKVNPVQTIDSRELALMEEHLLNYFVSDSSKSDYSEYVKVIRVYPDYASSACRSSQESEEEYSRTEGCATYNAYEASINLNGLTSIKYFFNSRTYIEGNMSYTAEPKRDTFAHEFGHVSTYYHMILKGDGEYQDYLKLRLGEAYDSVYPSGLPDSYDIENYYTQPVEILADDYVELYYDVSEKVWNDYNEYTLEYEDLRNSLSGVSGVVQYLKDNESLFKEMKDYFDVFINKDLKEFVVPIIVNASGNVFSTIHDINDNKFNLTLTNNRIIALGELNIDGLVYYRVILSNVVDATNSRREYSYNIGYILKEECITQQGQVLLFDNYGGSRLESNQYLQIESVYIMPYYDFSYFIVENGMIKLYNYLYEDFITIERDASLFQVEEE